MKQLKFEHVFARDIIAGKKTATFRVNDDKDIRPGDVVEMVDKVDRDHPNTWDISGELEITSVSQTPIRELTKDHLLRAEKFDNIEQMIEAFRRFYGEHINQDTLVSVLNFVYKSFDSPQKFIKDQKRSLAVPQSVWLYCDGGSRGNPGPSALGFVVLDEHKVVLHSDNKYIGITTNNQAEYHALLAGMEWCLAKGVRELSVNLDSLLVVNQLKGIFKVKNRDLWSLYETAEELATKFRKVKFTHVPRELNKLADDQVNYALDAVKGSDIVQ